MRAETHRQGAKGAGWLRFAAIGSVLGLLAAGLAWQGAAAAASGLLKVRFGGDQLETRMVIELDRATSARLVSSDADARRLQLKFDKLTAADSDGQGRGLVKAWSLNGSALTLDLTRAAAVKRRFLLPPGDGVDVYRYVIDVASTGRPTPSAHDQDPLGALIHTSLEAKPASETDPIRLKKVIVIDAGHGGKDPGASGTANQEKAITLAAAKTLKRRLEKGGRYKVVMTRERDIYVPLETRVQIARQAGADLFISLHADAAAAPDTRGATVYTLSEKGSDRAAKSVFQGGSFIDVDLPGRDRAVKQILLDLTQRATKNRSGAFAEVLLREISDDTPLLRRSHRDAGFVVLLAPDVPAVLLEMGFMSNRSDEANLADPARRARLMDGVGDSIDAYFDQQLRYASR
jgi:N-acetylmuramoyl-L-alanine amidase